MFQKSEKRNIASEALYLFLIRDEINNYEYDKIHLIYAFCEKKPLFNILTKFRLLLKKRLFFSTFLRIPYLFDLRTHKVHNGEVF